MPDSPRNIVIVGAGIVGICCARWLQRDGHTVQVIDRLAPGRSCSWGNAGVFATDAVVPLSTPRALRAVPRMLWEPASGVRIHRRALPGLLPWLARFVACGRPTAMARSMDALTVLLSRAESGLLPLIEGGPAEPLFRRTGWITVFENGKKLDRARWEFDQRRRQGIVCHTLDGGGLRALVPELADHVVGGFHLPGSAMVADPGGLVDCLAADVLADGGRIACAVVERIESTGPGVRIVTAAGSVDADHVVVAAGAWSGSLARSLGDRFPLTTERGYHAMIADAGISTAMPVMSGDHKFVTTPLRHGLRLAGTSEIGGLDQPPDPARVRSIVNRGRRLFPGLRAEHWDEWLGFRPTLPDSLPVIGRSPSSPAVSYAFGHQHLGLTLGGITGRLIADDLAGRESLIDLHPLRAGRF